MDIALVCHYEPPYIPGNDGYKQLERITDLFLEMGNQSALENNKSFHTTFCVGFDHGADRAVIREIPKVVGSLHNKGHEIGVHTHAPRDDLDSHINFLASDRLELMSYGIEVYSWAPGDWYHAGEETFKALDGAGFAYDLSVLPIFKPFDIYEGKYHIDHSSCRQAEPYHPAADNLCKKGKLNILEIPVLGLLDELRFGEGEFNPNMATVDELLVRISAYKEKYPDGIFQIVWHPFEFLVKGTADVDELFLMRISAFIAALASDPGIRFKTITGHFDAESELPSSDTVIEEETIVETILDNEVEEENDEDDT